MDYYLHSGEVLFSTEACTVKTLLGSCVGVAIHDPLLRIGGLCHYLLPEANDEPASTKYGDVALPFLLKKFLKAGSAIKDLRVWVAGGALLLDAQEIFFVGDRNAEFAEKWLEKLKLRVISNETRGYRGRKLIFQPCTGIVSIDFLSNSAVKDLLII